MAADIAARFDGSRIARNNDRMAFITQYLDGKNPQKALLKLKRNNNYMAYKKLYKNSITLIDTEPNPNINPKIHKRLEKVRNYSKNCIPTAVTNSKEIG